MRALTMDELEWVSGGVWSNYDDEFGLDEPDFFDVEYGNMLDGFDGYDLNNGETVTVRGRRRVGGVWRSGTINLSKDDFCRLATAEAQQFDDDKEMLTAAAILFGAAGGAAASVSGPATPFVAGVVILGEIGVGVKYAYDAVNLARLNRLKSKYGCS